VKTAEPDLDASSEDEDIETSMDGHTANRTDMLPWESCGPDCPTCGDFEK